MKAIALVLGTMVLLVVALGVYASAVGPENYVVPGGQISQKHMHQLQRLKLLPDGEEIAFYYSPAFFDLEDGLVVLTSKRIVQYDRDLAQPKQETLFTDIQQVDVTYSSEWSSDSTVWLTLKGGERRTFPLSKEKGGDHQFVKSLGERVGPTVKIVE